MIFNQQQSNQICLSSQQIKVSPLTYWRKRHRSPHTASKTASIFYNVISHNPMATNLLLFFMKGGGSLSVYIYIYLSNSVQRFYKYSTVNYIHMQWFYEYSTAKYVSSPQCVIYPTLENVFISEGCVFFKG